MRPPRLIRRGHDRWVDGELLKAPQSAHPDARPPHQDRSQSADGNSKGEAGGAGTEGRDVERGGTAQLMVSGGRTLTTKGRH